MVFLVSGIDTGIGKTWATAALGRSLRAEGHGFITAKLVQTGGTGLSADILEHRRLLGQPVLDDDRAGLTCPYVLPFPASPHLAARLAGREIDSRRIVTALAALESRHGIVLCEGAGGLMVPLDDDRTILDLAADQGWPVFLVTSGRLGSLNGTLLSLAALKHAGLPLAALVFNEHGGGDPVIDGEAKRYLARAVAPRPLWCLAGQGTADQPPSWRSSDPDRPGTWDMLRPD